MKILLASPRGFCAGVDRAIEIVERAIELYGSPVYVRHEIVHNQHVVDELREKGAVFIDDPADAPHGAHLVFSAHGVSPAVREAADQNRLETLDATCPLVTKVHNEVVRRVEDDFEIIMVGHAGHVEVEGTMGHAVGRVHLVETCEDVAELEVKNSEQLACVTQTTLSVDDTREILGALSARFPRIRLPKGDDICYATQNRQDAVAALSNEAELILVVGAPASSNSNRLVEVAVRRGVRSFLVQSAEDLDATWLEGVSCVGVTAGASTPEFLVEQLVLRIQQLAGSDAKVDALCEVDENMSFKLPPELRA